MTLPIHIQILEHVIERIGNDQVRMDAADKGSKIGILAFIDRHWDSSTELRRWALADNDKHL
jgi:hypothetical protein